MLLFYSKRTLYLLIRMLYLVKNDSYSNLAEHVPGIRNKESPTPKHIIKTRKTSGLKKTA